jgi:hypothetical protein
MNKKKFQKVEQILQNILEIHIIKKYVKKAVSFNKKE